MEQKKKCNRCKNEKALNEFISDAGRELKQCKQCRILQKEHRISNTCEHGKQKE